MPPVHRFVILSNARSGTTLLAASLDKHPEILCRLEIFGRNGRALSADELARRNSDPLEFARTMLEPDHGCTRVGFKMWRDQDRAVCDHLLGRTDVAKIIVERHNKLAQYASLQIAKQSGVWTIPATLRQVRQQQRRQEAQEFKADFDRLSFMAYLQLGQMLFDHYRRSANGPCLQISYNELVRDGLMPVLEFLGVARQASPFATERIHAANVVDRFKPQVHNEIVRTLAAIGRSDWLEEDLTKPEPSWQRLGAARVLAQAAVALPRWLMQFRTNAP